MNWQVDQSGRLEDAPMTVWAVADGGSRTIAISASVKRQAFATLKERGITGARALLRVYAAGLYLLLRDMLGAAGDSVELDREYPGYGADIKAMLLRRLRRPGAKVWADTISFASIGKKSPAHRAAWEVYVGRRAPDRRITWAELKRLL